MNLSPGTLIAAIYLVVLMQYAMLFAAVLMPCLAWDTNSGIFAGVMSFAALFAIVMLHKALRTLVEKS